MWDLKKQTGSFALRRNSNGGIAMAFDFKKEYKEFYRTVFHDYKEPLFCIDSWEI